MNKAKRIRDHREGIILFVFGVLVLAMAMYSKECSRPQPAFRATVEKVVKK